MTGPQRLNDEGFRVLGLGRKALPTGQNFWAKPFRLSTWAVPLGPSV